MQATLQGPAQAGTGLFSCAPPARELPHHAIVLDGVTLAGGGTDLAHKMFVAVLWSFAGPAGECSPLDDEIAARFGHPDPHGAAAKRQVQRLIASGEGDGFRRKLGPDGRTRVGFTLDGPPPRFAAPHPATADRAGMACQTEPSHGEIGENDHATDASDHDVDGVATLSEPPPRQATAAEKSRFRVLALEASLRNGWRAREPRYAVANYLRRLIDPDGVDPEMTPEAVWDALAWIWKNGPAITGHRAVIYRRARAIGIALGKMSTNYSQ